MHPDKEMKDWTFDELVDVCAWRAVDQLLKGNELRRVIWSVCDTACQWRHQQVSKPNSKVR